VDEVGPDPKTGIVRIQSRCCKVGDTKDGFWCTFGSNGRMQDSCFYKNDLPHGWWTAYGRDGRILQRTEYVDGIAHGRQERYVHFDSNLGRGIRRADGLPMESGTFVGNRLQGVYTVWKPSQYSYLYCPPDHVPGITVVADETPTEVEVE